MIVLTDQEPFYCSCLIKQGGIGLDSRRPTEVARVSDHIIRFKKAFRAILAFYTVQYEIHMADLCLQFCDYH